MACSLEPVAFPLANFCRLQNGRGFETIGSIVWLEEVWSWLVRRVPKPKGAAGNSTCLRSHGGIMSFRRRIVRQPVTRFSERGVALKSCINAGPHDLIGSCPSPTPNNIKLVGKHRPAFLSFGKSSQLPFPADAAVTLLWPTPARMRRTCPWAGPHRPLDGATTRHWPSRFC